MCLPSPLTPNPRPARHPARAGVFPYLRPSAMEPMFDCVLEMPHHFPLERLFAPGAQSISPPRFSQLWAWHDPTTIPRHKELKQTTTN